MGLGLKTEFHKSADRVLHTATADITAGVPQSLATGLVGIPDRDIANGDSDDLRIEGRVRARKISEIWAVGTPVGWDANGNPVGGTAGSGAYVKTAADWDFKAGVVAEAAVAGDEYGVILLNKMLV